MIHGSTKELIARLDRVRRFRDVMLSELQAFPYLLKQRIIRGVIEELAILHDLEVTPCRRRSSGPHRRMYCEGCGQLLKDMKANGVKSVIDPLATPTAPFVPKRTSTDLVA